MPSASRRSPPLRRRKRLRRRRPRRRRSDPAGAVAPAAARRVLSTLEAVPELPDVAVYVERLAALTVGKTLDAMRIASPFVLRTVSPSPRELHGAKVETVERLGKRIVIGVEPPPKAEQKTEEGAQPRFIVNHLMIAGRLRWKKRGEKVPNKVGLAAFDFPNGSMIFTEASPKKRASLHMVAGRAGLAEFDRGGLDVFAATPAQFAERLRSERHTIKRSLTDP